jgi:hypothetical protein
MKGTVQRPHWPAPAEKTATHSSPGETRRIASTALDALSEPRIDGSNQITLAILEESSVARTRGYDPYNKSAPAHRPVDAWHRKRKRD